MKILSKILSGSSAATLTIGNFNRRRVLCATMMLAAGPLLSSCAALKVGADAIRSLIGALVSDLVLTPSPSSTDDLSKEGVVGTFWLKNPTSSPVRGQVEMVAVGPTSPDTNLNDVLGQVWVKVSLRPYERKQIRIPASLPFSSSIVVRTALNEVKSAPA
jgi:hypothetical protein